jgi:FSR family fosmidomycin resistance protein-like MFS transporter
VILAGAVMVGFGSAVFHPESSRVARLASGGRYGLAQSVFQVGGNFGTAIGPLLAALIIVPFGQSSIAWFSVAALLGMIVLFNVGTWYRHRLAEVVAHGKTAAGALHLPHGRVAVALTILAVLVFSKFIYMSSLISFYTFYMIDRFDVSVQFSQILLFVFLFAVAVGTVAGGIVGDRYGRKIVIWVSIVGALPFTIALPYANFFWTVALTVIIGLVIASAFSAIVVMAHSVLPGRIGMVSGLFFGFAFGIAGIGAAGLGILADATSIGFVFKVCSFLPAFGLLTAFLPNVGGRAANA